MIIKEEIINKLSIDLEEIDIEKNIIIDYVVLCFLLGNDFLPKLINLDINENSIENLINSEEKIDISDEFKNKYRFIHTNEIWFRNGVFLNQKKKS